MPDTVAAIDTTLVTTGMPAEGGILYVNFDPDAVLPTDATTPLDPDDGWESLGDLDKDAMTETPEISSTSHEDYAGTEVLTVVDSQKQSLKVRLIEFERVAVNKLRFGPDNVSSTGEVLNSVANKGVYQGEVKMVAEEVESNGFKRRTCIDRAKIKSVGDVSHQKGSLMVHELTFSELKDANGRFSMMYRAKPASEPEQDGQNQPEQGEQPQ